jgi:hypothetical protein
MQRNRTTQPEKNVHLWTYPQAVSAVPYIVSVMRSLRETWLESRFLHRRSEQMAERPGKPDRAALVAEAEMARAAFKADQAFEDAADELRDLGILCEDPALGLALLPCVHQQLLAWIQFDLFSARPLRSWRYHNDPPEYERPIGELIAYASEPSLAG